MMPFGFSFKTKLRGYDLFIGIRRHGINTGQIRYKCIFLSADRTVFPVYRNAREITDMLVGAGQLVK